MISVSTKMPDQKVGKISLRSEKSQGKAREDESRVWPTCDKYFEGKPSFSIEFSTTERLWVPERFVYITAAVFKPFLK